MQFLNIDSPAVSLSHPGTEQSNQYYAFKFR